MKTWLIGALIVAFTASTLPTLAEAKRLGIGKSSGMQRNMPARTAPDAPPPKPAAPTSAGTPAQGAPATAGTAAAAGAAPAAAAGRSWMGPIAGLAAGLGIAALMSHLGMGEAFGNFLMIALLAVAAFFVIRLLMRRFAPQPQQRGMQYAGNADAPRAGQVAWPASSGSAATSASDKAAAQPDPVMSPAMPPETLPSPAAAQAAAAVETAAPQAEMASVPVREVPKAFVPATFDSESFERVAKMIFIRMQAANDSADLNDLRTFTTPEMFAALRLDLQDRGAAAQHTDVVKVDAKVLDVAQEAERQIVSVQFTGQVREETGGPLSSFDEVWHLIKPADDSRGWVIAGIEQSEAAR